LNDPRFTVIDIRLGSNGYVAHIGKAALIHSNDVAEIMSAVEKQAGPGRVWINTSAMDGRRRAALRATIERLNGEGVVNFTDGAEPIFEHTAKRRTLTVLHSGTYNSGGYVQRGTMRIGNSSFRIAVTCRLKAVAQAFIARLRRYFTGAPTKTSTMTIIDRVRRQVAKDYKLSETELSVAITDQFNATRYVELRRNANVFVR
jgi:hypothetical protein